MKRYLSSIFRVGLVLTLGVSFTFLNGCGESDRPAVTGANEASHPLLRKAEQRSRARDIDGAIALYNKALAENPELSHAHMMLGLIFQENKENFVRAIYHYERFLEIKPNSQKRGLVEQSIRHCRISFAATMKEADGDKLDLIQVLRADKKRLEKRNEELAEVVTRLSNRPTVAGPGDDEVAAPDRSRSAGENRTERARAGGVVLRGAAPEAARPEPGAAARSYKVQSGDTLSTIAKKMYGQSSRWKDIYEANRDTMRSQNDLKIGQDLKIP